jgi:LDH2 family malate/lactate/ureidoglycolate dehydrogenase
MKIKVSELRNQVSQALLKAGYNSDDAEMITNVVMFGQMSGKLSHGIVRLFKGDLNLLENIGDGPYEIVEKTQNSAQVIAHHQPGILIGHLAMNKAIELAKNNKIGLVSSIGTQSTSGCLTYYLEQIAKNSLIGIVMSQSAPFIAPFNSKEALFGTNPMGYGFPTNDKPLLFDMATSAITYGDVLIASTTGKQLPENIASDKSGNPTTNPDEALEGSVNSFDNSYKGSGLAMIVEILAGVLAGSSFIDLHQEKDWGNLFIAISPELFMSTDEFKSRMDEFINRVERAKTKDGQKVRLPGMHTLAQRDENIQDDEIEIEDEILNEFYKYL